MGNFKVLIANEDGLSILKQKKKKLLVLVCISMLNPTLSKYDVVYKLVYCGGKNKLGSLYNAISSHGGRWLALFLYFSFNSVDFCFL